MGSQAEDFRQELKSQKEGLILSLQTVEDETIVAVALMALRSLLEDTKRVMALFGSESTGEEEDSTSLADLEAIKHDLIELIDAHEQRLRIIEASRG